MMRRDISQLIDVNNIVIVLMSRCPAVWRGRASTGACLYPSLRRRTLQGINLAANAPAWPSSSTLVYPKVPKAVDTHALAIA
eukprot:3609609-Pyramimonas_sp.AAC.1